MDGEISWVSGLVTVFSPNDIPGLRRPKNVKFGTKMAIFGKSFLIVAKLAKKSANMGQKPANS